MTFSVVGAEVAVRRVRAASAPDLTSLSSHGLRTLLDAQAALRREAEMGAARIAAEIASRSEGVAAGQSFARRQGFRSAEALIAAVEGSSNAAASRLIDVGRVLVEQDALREEMEAQEREARRQEAQRRAAGGGSGAGGSEDEDGNGADAGAGGGGDDDSGEGIFPKPAPTPPPTPRQQARTLVAEAVRSSQIAGDAASVVLELVGALPEDDGLVPRIESVLRRARGLRLHAVRKLCWQVQAFADPAAWEEREKRQYEARRADVRDNADGTVTLTAVLPPIDAARIKAVLDDGVRRLMSERRNRGQVPVDDRTPAQMRADLLVSVFTHMTGCDRPAGGVKTTVVVRMTVDELRDGAGMGEIDGMSQPVSIGRLRRAAVDAEYLPVVLGGASVPLDVGRKDRAFTAPQRLALIERDGGCAWCNAPPSWCDAHHLDPWSRGGRTDLSKGATRKYTHGEPRSTARCTPIAKGNSSPSGPSSQRSEPASVLGPGDPRVSLGSLPRQRSGRAPSDRASADFGSVRISPVERNTMSAALLDVLKPDRSVATAVSWADAEGLRETLGGMTLGGMYRVFDVEQAEQATVAAVAAFPDLAESISEVFAADWLGRFFAIDALREADGDNLLLLLDVGGGEGFEIPSTLGEFHDSWLVNNMDILEEEVFRSWLGQGGHSPGITDSIGYRVPLFLGGEDGLENFELIDTDVYWAITGQVRVGLLNVVDSTAISSIGLDGASSRPEKKRWWHRR